MEDLPMEHLRYFLIGRYPDFKPIIVQRKVAGASGELEFHYDFFHESCALLFDEEKLGPCEPSGVRE
jgi:hypothetical protein